MGAPYIYIYIYIYMILVTQGLNVEFYFKNNCEKLVYLVGVL